MTRARDVADTQDNVGGSVAPFVAGKNKILNSDFSIWQRGTSFTNPAVLAYTADRYFTLNNGTSPTVIVSQESLLPNTIAGYNSEYFYRYNQTVAGTGATLNFPFAQRIENAKTLAGQTITFSLWVKSDSARSFTLNISYNLGTGGSVPPTVLTSDTKTSTTTWQRHTFTTTLPTLSGLTIGAGSFISVYISVPVNTVQTWDIWGLQFEQGNVATPFTTATGNPASELAACERYYQIVTGQMLSGINANVVGGSINFRTQMRTGPSVSLSAAMNLRDAGADYAQTSANVSITASRTNERGVQIEMANFPGTITANRPYFTNVTLSQIQFSAEL